MPERFQDAVHMAADQEALVGVLGIFLSRPLYQGWIYSRVSLMYSAICSSEKLVVILVTLLLMDHFMIEALFPLRKV